MTRYHRTLAVFLVLSALTTTGVNAQEPQTYRACFVPQVGAMYLLDLPGLPTACLSESHEEISWFEGGPLADGSVTAPMIAADAVDSTHIAAGSVGASELNVRYERIQTEVRIESNGTTQVTIECTLGREILSGGADPSASVEIQSSFPLSDTTWYMRVLNTSPDQTTVRVAVVCADLG